MALNKKAVYQWCRWLDQLITILFTWFACWVDLRIGLFFTGYVLVRAVCTQIREEERLLEELDREQHTGCYDTPEKSNHGPEYPGH